jgi:hypothetical protein
MDYTLDSRYLDPLGVFQTRVQRVINEHGWDGYKETIYADEIRNLIQRLGTEGGRELLGENVWVDATIEKVWYHENVVISDVRFPNEHAAIKDFPESKTFWIHRPGITPANGHSSELTLTEDDFDETINNDGGLEELKTKVLSRVGKE